MLTEDDRDLIARLSRQSIAWLTPMSEMVGAALQWDEDWLARHCRAKSTGACRLIGGRSGEVAGEVNGNAPRVVNRHHFSGRDLPAAAVYVGRGTPLGNPFTVKAHGEDALGLYRRRLADMLRDRHPPVLEAMRAIKPDSLLVCSCWPRPCHADVIRSAWCWMRGAGML